MGLAIRNIAKNDWWHLLFESFWAIQDCWGCLGHWRRTWNPGEPPPLLHRNTVQPQDAKYNFGVFSRHLFFCVCFFSTTFFFGGNTTKCNMLFITYTTCFFSYDKYHESWIYTYAYNTTVYKCTVFGGSNAAFFHRENTSYLSKLVLLMVCDQWLIPQEHMN